MDKNLIYYISIYHILNLKQTSKRDNNRKSVLFLKLLSSALWDLVNSIYSASLYYNYLFYNTMKKVTGKPTAHKLTSRPVSTYKVA